jgi:hypothetical protein
MDQSRARDGAKAKAGDRMFPACGIRADPGKCGAGPVCDDGISGVQAVQAKGRGPALRQAGSAQVPGVDPSSGSGPRTGATLSGRFVMSLVNLVVTLVLVGVGLWVINTYVPMDRKIRQILNVVVVIFVIIWLLYGFGLMGNMGAMRVGG